MTDLLHTVVSWKSLLLVVLLFGFAPGFCLRLLVLAYPRSDPRRTELIAELYTIPRIERPLWVAEQLETALFEGLPHRLAAVFQWAARLHRARAKVELRDALGPGLVAGLGVGLVAWLGPGFGLALVAGFLAGVVGCIAGGLRAELRAVAVVALLAGLGGGLGAGLVAWLGAGLVAWLVAGVGAWLVGWLVAWLEAGLAAIQNRRERAHKP